MPDRAISIVAILFGSGGLVASVAPRLVEAWKHRTKSAMDLAEKVIDQSAEFAAHERDDHKACRDEVARLSSELGELRASVASCEAKHTAAQQTIDWLKVHVDRLLTASGSTPLPPEHAE